MKKLLISTLLVLVLAAAHAQITIVTPTTGQTTVIGQSLTVYYTSPTYVSMGTIEVYKGATKVYTHSSAYQSTNHNIPTGSFAAGTDYRVKVYDASNPSYNAWSGYFSIVTSPPIPTVAYPTSVTATSFIANWNSAAGATGYRVDVSADNFVTMLSGYSNLAVTGTSVTVSGTLPNIIYQYRVRTVIGAATSASSTAMKAGFLKDWIIAPNGRDAFFSEDFIYVQVDYALNPGYGGLFCELYDGATRVFPPAGSSPFSSQSLPTSGFPPGDNYLVRVWDASNPTLEDWSDEPFSILPVSRKMNALNVEDIVVPGLKSSGAVRGANIGEKRSTAEFYDGLGRKVQRIEKQASPGRNDIVQPIVYDPYDRVTKEYLSYASGQKHGWYITNPAGLPGSYSGSAHQQYYANGASDKVADDAAPYSITVLEPSPLNRVLKKYDPGASWHAAANNKFIQFDYLTNIHGTETSLTHEAIIAWEVNGSGALVRSAALAGSVTSTGHYLNGMLAIDETTDENGYRIRQYTNRSGKVVLKKVQVVNAITSLNDPLQWAFTYYVYDKYGSLTYVLQPELSRIVSPTSDTAVPDQPTIDNLAFQYVYDDRYRLVEKKIPGSGRVYMVYDHRDRLVATQDAEQRKSGNWVFTKYDECNRPILTGIKDTTINLIRSNMQLGVNQHYAKSWARSGETYTGNAVGNVHGYSNKSYPVVTASNTLDANKYLTITYYDTYDFRSLWTGSYTYTDENLSVTTNGVIYSQPDIEFTRVNGQITGVKVKVLDGGITGGVSWLKSVTYYDEKYRAIQTINDNYKQGTDRVSNLYDFTSNVLKSKTSHQENDITWKDLTSGIAKSGERLYRSASGSDNNQGAASVAMLAANQDGWFEFTHSNANMLYIGFSPANTNPAYTSIEFCLGVGGTTYTARKSGGSATNIGTHAIGDVFRIERVSGTVRIRKNGTIMYTFPGTSTSALLVDVSFYTGQSSVLFARSSFSASTSTVTRTLGYDHAGRLENIWHKLDSGPEILLSKNVYNELGQLIDKKLHSTVAAATDAKQSIDYRYNIRGWMTKINESDVNLSVEAGETRDLFGMELLYNTLDAGVSNSVLYNGNISAIKWSNSQSLGPIKENAYTYGYDAMNRLLSSSFQERSGTWSTLSDSRNAESGLEYDLNGNISKLKRNDKRTTGLKMDDLVYQYTDHATGISHGNRLMKVTDNGDDFKGFKDGTNAGNDYAYDDNGNMTLDYNKGITTAITYNYLNLPEVVTRGGASNSIRYIYDATGRKLAQVVSLTGPDKQTDYAGEYIYENDALQFISHEEGRIAVAKETLIYKFEGSNQAGIGTTANVSLTNETVGDESYLKITAAAGTALNRRGITPIGGMFTVAAGEKYLYRVKGYRSGEIVNLYVKGNGSDLLWPAAQLTPEAGNKNDVWVEAFFTIPSGITSIELGVLWNSSATSTQYFYINEIELVKLGTQNAEYQYHLKDHLGNVRLTFTTKEEIVNETATLETANAAAEQGKFVRFAQARKVQSHLFDRTNGSFPSTANGYAQRLNGSANEKYGLAKSISVMPGDVIQAQVYAKYIDPVSSNWTTALSNLLTQISMGTAPAGTVVDGVSYSSSTSSFPFTTDAIQNTSGSNETGPKVYLNWLVYDRNYNFIAAQSGYDRLSTAPKETGQDVAHELLLSPNITVQQPGYVYIYLSNEEAAPLEAYFDEFKVTHTKSPVIQQDDYYAFGLNFNSYQRENSTKNNFLYNSKEKQDELDLGWLDYGARMYMPEIGRFSRIDRLAEKYVDLSSYQYGANNPINLIDINGDSLTISMQGQASIDAMKDLMSLIKTTGVAISANEKGSISLNFGNMTEAEIAQAIKDDPGLALLNDIVSAKENYLYESSPKEAAKDRITGEVFESEESEANFGSQFYVRNLSKTPRDIGGHDPQNEGSDYTVAAQKRPNQEFDGHVRITNKSGSYFVRVSGGTKIYVSRSSLVFHELAESYARTTLREPYERTNGTGAHQYANTREGNSYKNPYPGSVQFEQKK